jgi:hypothetical protein
MGATKSKWQNGQLAFYDGTTYETVLPLSPIYLYDDFLGTVVNADVWTEVDTNNATKATLHSISTYSFTNTDQIQDAGLYGGLDFNLDKKPIFECRLAITTSPDNLSELMIGLSGDAYVSADNVAAADDIDIHAFFVFDGSLVCTIYADDGSSDNNAVATGITVTGSAYHIFRIDCSNVADVRFYIDGVRVGAATTISMANGTDVMVRPYIVMTKSGGAGLGVYTLDYIRVWQATR